MRSLELSITFTCTLTVSPGPKAGMSSRRDVWSTKSSVFIGTTSSRSRLYGTCLRAVHEAVAEPMDSGVVVFRAAQSYLGCADNCSIVPDGRDGHEIAGQLGSATTRSSSNIAA